MDEKALPQTVKDDLYQLRFMQPGIHYLSIDYIIKTIDAKGKPFDGKASVECLKENDFLRITTASHTPSPKEKICLIRRKNESDERFNNRFNKLEKRIIALKEQRVLGSLKPKITKEVNAKTEIAANQAVVNKKRSEVNSLRNKVQTTKYKLSHLEHTYKISTDYAYILAITQGLRASLSTLQTLKLNLANTEAELSHPISALLRTKLGEASNAIDQERLDLQKEIDKKFEPANQQLEILKQRPEYITLAAKVKTLEAELEVKEEELLKLNSQHKAQKKVIRTALLNGAKGLVGNPEAMTL